MRVALVGTIWLSIPPKKYGGTEEVIANLANGLVDKGHDVTLFAPEGTKTKAKLSPTVTYPLRENNIPWTDVSYHLYHFTQVFDRADEFDVIHVHLNKNSDYIALPLSLFSSTPTLFTTHFALPTPQYKKDRFQVLEKYRDLPFTSISHAQQKGSDLNFIANIYNALDLNQYPFRDSEDRQQKTEGENIQIDKYPNKQMAEDESQVVSRQSSEDPSVIANQSELVKQSQLQTTRNQGSTVNKRPHPVPGPSSNDGKQSVTKDQRLAANDYFLWLGKISAHKGTKEAILAAKQAGARLVIAGVVDAGIPENVAYFEKEVQPHIDGKQIQYVGEVGLPQKAILLGNAKALLNPIQWEEPFGLVMIEAEATGTPVIAFNRGAAKEVVQDGITGFLVRTVDEMVKKMKEIDKLDREKNRAFVEKKFSLGQFIHGYEEVYEKTITHWERYISKVKETLKGYRDRTAQV